LQPLAVLTNLYLIPNVAEIARCCDDRKVWLTVMAKHKAQLKEAVKPNTQASHRATVW
jgi:hypothetical protein